MIRFPVYFMQKFVLSCENEICKNLTIKICLRFFTRSAELQSTIQRIPAKDALETV